MGIIKEYLAIKAPSTNDLTEWVNTHIEFGWQPFGGISSSTPMVDENGNPSNTIVFSQAMVKY